MHLARRGYGIILGAILLLAIGKEVIDAVRLGSKPVTTVDKVRRRPPTSQLHANCACTASRPSPRCSSHVEPCATQA